MPCPHIIFMEPSSTDSNVNTSSFSIVQYIGELVKIIIIAAAIILPIRLFVVQPFYVKGLSMYPTFDSNDYLIVDEVSYRFTQPTRGDVVVFMHDQVDHKYFIKRVIGLPGETVEVVDSTITIFNAEHPNGFILDEQLYAPIHGPSMLVRTALKDDEYFVLGDNRPVSYDSRRFGPIHKSEIAGRVLLRGLPFDKFQFFSTPQYNITTP